VPVGLSLTGTPEKEKVMLAVEPYASPLRERMAALEKAHLMGLRTYGMLCPLLPGIADGPEQIDRLVWFCKSIGVEEVFAEAVNPRANGLVLTEQALRSAGFASEADAVGAIRRVKAWSNYVARLVKNVQTAARRYQMIDKLRFLLYPKRLTAQDCAWIKEDEQGVVWLG
jgi:DNA repair photolyase